MAQAAARGTCLYDRDLLCCFITEPRLLFVAGQVDAFERIDADDAISGQVLGEDARDAFPPIGPLCEVDDHRGIDVLPERGPSCMIGRRIIVGWRIA